MPKKTRDKKKKKKHARKRTGEVAPGAEKKDSRRNSLVIAISVAAAMKTKNKNVLPGAKFAQTVKGATTSQRNARKNTSE